jgi:RNA polymerase sigma-70 factor (ECF subfamily)
MTAHDDLSDLELARHYAVTRDERVFSLLYGRHSAAVNGLLRRLSAGAEEDVKEILQETWIRAMQKIRNFRGDAKFRTWLIGIAVNCHRERRRRERASVHEEVSEAVGGSLVRAADATDVTECLAALSVEHREVLVLHDVEGFTHEEISSFLGIEQGTSKSRLFRARQAFRERWGGRRTKE